jgi:uncharacterized membrane protein YbhN (UPF0104 family)
MSPGRATKPNWLKNARGRQIARVFLSAGVTVGLLAWVFSHANTDALRTLIVNAKLGWVGLAALLIPLQVLLMAARWQRVAQDLGLPMTRGYAVREYALSTLLNQILPGGMTGDAVRIWRHKSGHGSVGAPLRAAVVERAMGHVAHLLLTLLGLSLWATMHGEGTRPVGALALVIGMLAFFSLGLAVPKRMPGFGKLSKDGRVALATPGRFAFHTVVSAALLGTFLLSFTFCSLAFDHPLGIAALTAIPLVMLVMVVPFSVGGWGLREASAATVLVHLGWSTEAALAVSAAYGVSVLIGALPGVLVVFHRGSSG